GCLAERLDVGGKRLARLPILFDEGREARAAGERLEAEGAGPRENVEDARLLEDRRRSEAAVSEDVEERLARSVRGRAHGVAWRRRDAPAAMPTGDDPHELAWPRHPAARGAPAAAPPRPRRGRDDRAGRDRRPPG